MTEYPLDDSIERREADALRFRVLSSVPASQYAFDTLLRLLDVSVSRSVPTAAVRCGNAPVMLVNPDFAAARCHTDEALFMLVMHELHHVLLGHTRLFPRATPAHNFAFDAVINSHLSMLFTDPAYTALFRESYPADAAPWFLLRPPEGWPGQPSWPEPSSGIPARLCDLYRSLYSPTGLSHDEIFNALAQTLGENEPEPGNVDGIGPVEPIFLGDHEDDGSDDPWGTQHEDRKLIVSTIRSIVEKWPPANHPRGRSLSDAARDTMVPKVPPQEQAVRAVRLAFMAAAEGRNGRLGRKGEQRLETLLRPLPDMRDRRAAVAGCLGFEPLFYESRHTVTKPGAGGKVHVYLDVSGSMNPYLPAVYAGLRPFALDMHPKVHLFSTRVRDVPVRDLVRGLRLTDGGTDIAPVIGHLLASGAKKALIITDGYVGPVSRADTALLKQRGVSLTVLLTPGAWRRDLESVAAQTFELPQLY